MMAALPSRTTCIATMFLFLTLLALPAAQGVYIKDKRKHQNSGEKRRGSKENPTTEGTVERSSNKKQREPFQRTMVLCNDDDECGRKYFCHGGEGHKSCLPCRKSRRRCNRDGMCCAGRVCMEGKCVAAEMRYEASYHTRWQSVDSGEESISQHTKDNIRKRREGETCSTEDSCDEGLCCAQHFWNRICKRILEEGDVCTKKRDRLTSIFQRCHCGKGLGCKRDVDSAVRVFSCQVVKDHSSKKKGSSKEITTGRVDNESSVFEEEARIGVAWDTSREQSDLNNGIFYNEDQRTEVRHTDIETQDIKIL
ncbi:dickkopf-related protein 2-like [Amphiura filiformis]|uniref:dickkopf-related protein 2-like n=1 Tax=Amphiura filiformis TaxID=82378 RepID=UPI003B2219EA